jgi:hypothetical protein
MNYDKVPNEAIKQLILASAPERQEEFDNFWNTYNPQVVFTEDKSGFTLKAGAYGSVLFDHKTMCHLWLLGFSAQYAYHAYLYFLTTSQLAQIPFSPNLPFIKKEFAIVLQASRSIINDVQQLTDIDNIDHFNWPAAVPEPDFGKPKDINGGMVFDLLCMAAGYCFLHELCHVKNSLAKKIIDPIDEEYHCDEFALKFLLSKIDIFANQTKWDKTWLYTKRAMGYAILTLLYLVMTPEKKWVAPSTDHPPVIERIKLFVKYIDGNVNEHFWTYYSCILLAQISRTNINIEDQVIKDQREYCLLLIDNMEQQIVRKGAYHTTY